LQSEQGEARLELDRVRQTLEQYQRELAALQNELEGDLHITLPANSAPQQMHLDLKVGQATLPPLSALPAGLEDQLRSLKATIRRQGDVNPEAPAEYAETNARFTFMRTQEDDLRSAIASLREVIVELDALVEHEMLATFKQVRQWFSTYFNMLFSGGSASLYLTDPEHPSDSGVDISARPPGKRTTSLSMLSGGERSLTAVALIFSLLQAHPVPFCFLDEVDAALDEANIFRFRDLLRSHASDTQFIIITHNRRTIEIAQTIYGIAMGEQGISQVVSLKVDG